jgi:hypothetical protein
VFYQMMLLAGPGFIPLRGGSMFRQLLAHISWVLLVLGGLQPSSQLLLLATEQDASRLGQQTQYQSASHASIMM